MRASVGATRWRILSISSIWPIRMLRMTPATIAQRPGDGSPSASPATRTGADRPANAACQQQATRSTTTRPRNSGPKRSFAYQSPVGPSGADWASADGASISTQSADVSRAGLGLTAGTAWECHAPGNWQSFGTLPLGSPTPALHESWGSLKSRYAPSHAPTSQTPTNR